MTHADLSVLTKSVGIQALTVIQDVLICSCHMIHVLDKKTHILVLL